MSTIYGKNIETITIPFPEEKYNSYLKRVGVASEKEVTMSMLETMLVAIIADFKKGSTSLDELSEVLGHLWDCVFHSYPTEQQYRHSEIDSVLSAGAELNYEVRHIESPGERDFIEDMSKVLQFYNQHSSF